MILHGKVFFLAVIAILLFLQAHAGEHTDRSVSYFRNGKVKSSVTTYYDKGGTLYKTMYERFRKNGNRRYVSVMEYGAQQTYYAKYDRNDKVRVEKYWYYNAQGGLVSMEVKRNGNTRVETYAPLLQGTTGE